MNKVYELEFNNTWYGQVRPHTRGLFSSRELAVQAAKDEALRKHGVNECDVVDEDNSTYVYLELPDTNDDNYVPALLARTNCWFAVHERQIVK